MGVGPSFRLSIFIYLHAHLRWPVQNGCPKLGCTHAADLEVHTAQPHRKYCLSHFRLQQVEALEQLAPGILQFRPTGAVGVCIKKRQFPSCMLLKASSRRQNVT